MIYDKDKSKIDKGRTTFMKKMLLSLFAVALTVCGLGSVASVSPAYAKVPDKVNEWVTSTNPTDVGTTDESTLQNMVKTIVNVVLGVVGFIAVFMIILGGINFITSQGDTAKVTKARNTILYGVIGLVIALLAFAIVNFVLTGVFGE